jgi:polyisoprenoid-binding protein YceI
MTGFRRGFHIVISLIAVPAALSAQAHPRKPAAKAHLPATPVQPPTPLHFALAGSGNEARFIVHEKLMIFESASNAIGMTRAITGGITLLPNGQVDSLNSRITVDLRTLTSDKENRDKWIKAHTLKTDSFPYAVFVIRQAQGLPDKLPTSGTLALKLAGDLMIHGVSHPTAWTATLTAAGNDYTGTASTHVKFGDFKMQQPRLMIVESVVDDITLQFDFHFTSPPPVALR